MVIVTGIPLGLKGVFAGCDSLPKGTVTVVREEPSGLMALSLELKQAVRMSAAWNPSLSATDIQGRYGGPQQERFGHRLKLYLLALRQRPQRQLWIM